MTPDKVEAALTALRHVAIAIEHGSTHRDDGVFIREALSVLTEALAAGVVSSEPAQYSNFKYLTNSPSSPELVEKQNAYAVLPMQILPAEFAGRRVRMIAEETP